MGKEVIFKIAGGNKHSDEKMSLKNVSFLAERKNNTQIGNWDFTLGCIPRLQLKIKLNCQGWSSTWSGSTVTTEER